MELGELLELGHLRVLGGGRRLLGLHGGLLCGLPGRVVRFDPASGALDTLLTLDDGLPGNRNNDGYIDPAGRLWFGSMDNGEQAPTGALYRWDGRRLQQKDVGYIITNGPCISPDGRILMSVADVCGKGLQAALIASMLHTMVRATVDNGRPLVELAQRLNKHLCSYLPMHSFVTMVCVALDLGTGRDDFTQVDEANKLFAKIQRFADRAVADLPSHRALIQQFNAAAAR